MGAIVRQARRRRVDLKQPWSRDPILTHFLIGLVRATSEVLRIQCVKRVLFFYDLIRPGCRQDIMTRADRDWIRQIKAVLENDE